MKRRYNTPRSAFFLRALLSHSARRPMPSCENRTVMDGVTAGGPTWAGGPTIRSGDVTHVPSPPRGFLRRSCSTAAARMVAPTLRHPDTPPNRAGFRNPPLPSRRRRRPPLARLLLRGRGETHTRRSPAEWRRPSRRPGGGELRTPRNPARAAAVDPRSPAR
jgi:hypothetical protein